MTSNHEVENKLKQIIVNITRDHDSDTLEEVMDEYVTLILQQALRLCSEVIDHTYEIYTTKDDPADYAQEVAAHWDALRVQQRARLSEVTLPLNSKCR